MGQIYSNKIGAKAAKEKKAIARLDRLDIIAPLYKRGWSFRELRKEVMARLNIETYALSTVKQDVDYLLKEWRDSRVTDVDKTLQLELERIESLVQEAWEAWDKSKEDYQKMRGKQVAVPNVEGEGGSAEGEDGVIVVKMEQSKEDMRSCGDPRYIDTINKLLQEKRKLLGLYAPDKQLVDNNFSFADYLMKTGQKK